MDAVIIAAGKGTRMGPLTQRRPKPLLPVGESTLIERIVRQCGAVVDRCVVVVGYRGDRIRETLGDRHAGTPIEYVEQGSPLGTAHAVGQAASVVDDRFLVLNGDVIVDDDVLERLGDAHGTAMAVQEVPEPEAYGVVETRGRRVARVTEKPTDPASNLVNTGLYAFEPSIFDYVRRTDRSPRGEFEITRTIELAIGDGRPVRAVEYDGTWLDVGRPWELLDATAHVLADLEGRVDGSVEPGAHRRGDVVVADGARIRSGAYLEGPVVVGPNADVGPNASVQGPAVVGPGVQIGNAVEIEQSVLCAGARVGHLSSVSDSVIGPDADLGAGTIVANRRHDREPVRMTVKGRRVDTGRRRLGIVAGDGARTGIDANVDAGVVLGVDARTEPGETVTRDRTREASAKTVATSQ